MKDEIKAGLVIVVSVILLSGVVILVGGSRFFEKSDLYYTEVMNAAGLETGAQVRLGGVRVGRVLHISEPTGPGKPVTIRIAVRKGTVLYKGTKALITQVGFVGDLYLLLAIDNTSSERIEVGDKIPAEEAVEFTRIMAKLDGLSSTVDSLARDVNALFSPENRKRIESLVGNTNKAIVSTSAHLEKVASGLKGAADEVETLLREVEGIVKDSGDDVRALIRKAREDLEKAEQAIAAIESTARSVDKTSQSFDGAISVQSQNLDALFNAMTRTTEDLQEVLQEIKSKPWSVVYRE
jgi:ABC-type transporter Mla subunit MlaD